MIRTESLTKFYASRCVVDGVSFSIADREIVGFLGLNGAGKTTSLRMLAGLLTPSSGRIEIDGKDLLDDPLAMQWRIGFLPEPPPLYEDMRVSGYLEFAARLKGLDASAAKRRVGDVLELCDLRDVSDDWIQTLSHGFKQRVGIAQAIVHEPDFVILDEPINGLDPVQIVEMRALIRRLKDQHTVLLSSHILGEISQTCDRVLILSRGRLVGEKTLTGDSLSLHLEVRGETAAVEAAVRSVSGVESIKIVGEGGGVVDVEVTLAADRLDQSEAIARAVVSAGLGLRRIDTPKSQLETTFLKLTGSN
ncbi:MAG: ABC transporter ATP-binding protein [Deltaproteobacteria bacterium]|nr:ABC transporter ATP-binding protein [Deltaproteobacteria bacterium]